MFECSTGLSRMYVVYSLLSTPTCPILDTLGKKLSFEIAVGLNGRVWVCRHLVVSACHILFLVSFEALAIIYDLELENFHSINFSFPLEIVVSSRSMPHLHLQLSS